MTVEKMEELFNRIKNMQTSINQQRQERDAPRHKVRELLKKEGISRRENTEYIRSEEEEKPEPALFPQEKPTPVHQINSPSQRKDEHSENGPLSPRNSSGRRSGINSSRFDATGGEEIYEHESDDDSFSARTPRIQDERIKNIIPPLTGLSTIKDRLRKNRHIPKARHKIDPLEQEISSSLEASVNTMNQSSKRIRPNSASSVGKRKTAGGPKEYNANRDSLAATNQDLFNGYDIIQTGSRRRSVSSLRRKSATNKNNSNRRPHSAIKHRPPWNKSNNTKSFSKLGEGEATSKQANELNASQKVPDLNNQSTAEAYEKGLGVAKSQMRSIQAQYSSVKRELTEMSQENQKLLEEKRKLHTKFKKVYSSQVRYERKCKIDAAKYEKSIHSLKKRIGDLKQKLTDEGKSIPPTPREEERDPKPHDSEKNEKAGTTPRFQKNLLNENRKLMKQVSLLKEKYNSLLEEKSAINNEKQKVEEQFVQQFQQIEALRQHEDVDTEKKPGFNMEDRKLRRQLSSIKLKYDRDMNTIKKYLEEIRAKNEKQVQDLESSKRTEIAKLNRTINHLKKKQENAAQDTIRARLNKVEKQKDLLLKENEQLIAEKHQLQQQLKDKTATLKRILTENLMSKSRIKSLHDEKSAFDESVVKANEMIDDLRLQFEDEKKALQQEYDEQLHSEEQKLLQAQNTNSQLSIENKSLLNKVSSLTAEIEDLHQTVEEQQLDIQELTEELQKARDSTSSRTPSRHSRKPSREYATKKSEQQRSIPPQRQISHSRNESPLKSLQNITLQSEEEGENEIHSVLSELSPVSENSPAAFPSKPLPLLKSTKQKQPVSKHVKEEPLVEDEDEDDAYDDIDDEVNIDDEFLDHMDEYKLDGDNVYINNDLQNHINSLLANHDLMDEDDQIDEE